MPAPRLKAKVINEFPEGQFKDKKPLSDYIAVTRTLCMLPVAISIAIVRNTFSGSRRKPVRDVVSESAMGHCYKSSTLRQLRILTLVKPLRLELSNPIFWLYSTGLPNYNTLFEGEGFNARWISEVHERKPGDPVLLYIHGGGYALKMCQPQIQYICQLAKRLLPHRISVLALDYTITPFFKFPSQRNEGLACLRMLERSCNRIILMGDSCGGNLALSMLLAEDKIAPQSIWGLVLVSPWTDLTASSGSMDSSLDILSKERLEEMTAHYAEEKILTNPLVSPVAADPEVWQRVLPRNTVVVWGEDECLADQCAAWVHLSGVENYFVERHGTHDCILRGLSPQPSNFVTQNLLRWSEKQPSATEAKLLEWSPSDAELTVKNKAEALNTTHSLTSSQDDSPPPASSF